MAAVLEKRYSGAPFGVQTARFDVAGVHPANKRAATYTQAPYDRRQMSELSRSLGPAKYDAGETTAAFGEAALSRRAAGPGWARQREWERTAALPHLLHKDAWEARRLTERRLGPGSHELKDFLQLADEKPRSRHGGACATLERRFRDPPSDTGDGAPGPGSYGEGGVPHAALEWRARQSASTIGLLDAASSGKRDLPTVGCHIGPGTYEARSFVDELAARRVSERGPYELFSIDRQQPIATGHYAKQRGANLGPGQYEAGSFVDELGSKRNRAKGKFATIEQHPQRGDRIFCSTLSQRPLPGAATAADGEGGGGGGGGAPGPASYDPHEDRSRPLTVGQPGFLSSASRQDRRAMRFFTRNFNPVGPGRYEVQRFRLAEHRNGHQSVFKSKTGRLTDEQERAFRERVRSKDVLPEDRQHLVAPERPATPPSFSYGALRSRTVA